MVIDDNSIGARRVALSKYAGVRVGTDNVLVRVQIVRVGVAVGLLSQIRAYL